MLLGVSLLGVANALTRLPRLALRNAGRPPRGVRQATHDGGRHRGRRCRVVGPSTATKDVPCASEGDEGKSSCFGRSHAPPPAHARLEQRLDTKRLYGAGRLPWPDRPSRYLIMRPACKASFLGHALENLMLRDASPAAELAGGRVRKRLAASFAARRCPIASALSSVGGRRRYPR